MNLKNILNVSKEQRIQKLQEIITSLEEEKLSDPKIHSLIKDFFKDKNEAISLIKAHNGKVSAIISLLDQLGKKEAEIDEFCKKILDIKKGEGIQAQPTPKITVKEPINLRFCCDVDIPDKNGAMIEDFCDAIRDEMPTVVTQSIFRGTYLKKGEEEEVTLLERDLVMQGVEERFEIYSSGSYLVFVPKKIGNDLTPKERLQKLDLSGKALRKVTLEEAYLSNTKKATIEDFQKLFSPRSKKDKFIHIVGHGGVGRPAGFNQKNYLKFLRWAEAQRCKGLLVSSCYAGGKSTLLHLPQEEESAPIKYQSEAPKGISFPVFAKSIGEFPTTRTKGSEKYVDKFFSKLPELLNSPGGHTIFRLRRVLQDIGDVVEKQQNLVQVYFPHSIDSPGGFRPVGEGKESKSLSYAQYRKEQIESGKIIVPNKEFVEIAPGWITCPILIKDNPSVLLSLIPGKAHHLLNEVQLDVNPMDFIKKNIDFYRDADLGASKVLFIGQLSSKDKVLSQVFIDLEKGLYGFKEGDRYYLNERGSVKDLSLFEFLLRWHASITRSLPNEKALKAVTGGQQDSKQISKELMGKTFWGDESEEIRRYQELLSENFATKKYSKDFQGRIDALNLSEKDKKKFINFLLSVYRNEELALALYKNWDLPADWEVFKHACNYNCVKLVDALLKKNVETDFVLPIMSACAEGYPELLDRLLTEEKLNLQAEISKGRPLYLYAIEKEEFLKKCLKKDSHLDLNCMVTDDNQQHSLLTEAIIGNCDSVEYLVKHGANPDGNNQEDMRPLSQAIIQGNQKVINFLLDHGASPYKMNPKGRTPIEEAFSRGSIELVKRLLSCDIPETEETSDLRDKIFASAFETGDETKIRLALEMKPTLSKTWLYLWNIEVGVKRLMLFKRTDLLKELFKKVPYLERITISNLIYRKEFDVLEKLMDTSLDLKLILTIISKAINLGADLTEETSDLRDKIFASAFETGDETKIRLALEMKPTLSKTWLYLWKIEAGVKRLILSKRTDLLKELFKKVKYLGRITISNLIYRKEFDVLEKLMDTSLDLKLILNTVISKEEIDEKLRFSIISKAINLGADLKDPTYLEVALQKKDIKLAKFLIENGAVVSPDNHEVFKFLVSK